MVDVVVVGAGLFGSIISAGLKMAGHNVAVFADQRQGMASTAAGCLMRPSWAALMSRPEFEGCLALLDQLYGVKQLRMQVPAGFVMDCWWVDPAKILVPPLNNMTVFSLDDNPLPVKIIATGAFKTDLVPSALQDMVEPKRGVSFLFNGELKHPFIEIWAPYKQIVALQMTEDTIWIGDGSSLKPASWNTERVAQSRARCVKALRDRGIYSEPHTMHWGDRPYVSGLTEPALLTEFKPGTWYATGGAKNGTLGAAWCALQLIKALS